MPAKLNSGGLGWGLVHLALHRSGPVRREQDVAETAAFWIERHDDDSFATAEGARAALGTGETVAARSGLVLAQGVLPFKGAARYAESSTPCGPAARVDAIRGATWALRRRYGEDP